MKRLFQALFATLLVVATAATAVAQQPNGSLLDTIRQRKKVIIGVLVDAPPFGMMNAQMQPAGYDIDVGRMLAKDLNVEVEFVPTTLPNRIPYLQSGRVDFIMAAFSVTPERALSVNFTSPYGLTRLVVIGPRDEPVTKGTDLAGKTIAVVRGGAQDTAVTGVAPPSARIQRYDDDAAVAAAVSSGQASFAGIADSTGKALMERAAQRNLAIKFAISESPFSIGIRKGDLETLHWLNTWVYFHRRARTQLNQLHEQYFGAVMPADLGFF